MRNTNIILKLNTTQKREQQKHSKTKLAWFSRLLRHAARNEMGIYNDPKPTWGQLS